MSDKKECDYCETGEIFSLVNGKMVSNLINKGTDTLVCPECDKKGYYEANERQKQAGVALNNMQAPIDINDVLRTSREVDSRIQVRTDVFNAATTAIVDLKKAIDADESITNKPFALATELSNRFNHYKTVIFELNEKVVEASNNQKAIQIYLNQLANSLRAEEREKLKISDINYKPKDVKTPVTAKTIKLSKKRLDKKEVKDFAAKLGIPEFTLQMICIQKNMSAEQGYNMLKKSIEDAKAQAIVANPEQIAGNTNV